MGMTCSLHRVSSHDLDELVRHPETLARVLGLDDGPPVREVRLKGILGLLLRLSPITISEVDPDASSSSSAVDPEKTLDIDKAWHGLHFLFTGSGDEGSEPACYMLKGGHELDDDGFARALKPEQVRRFAGFLASLTEADLDRRYNPERMTTLKIYPFDDWNRQAVEEDPRRWLHDALQDLRGFVQRLADAGDGLVVHIS